MNRVVSIIHKSHFEIIDKEKIEIFHKPISSEKTLDEFFEVITINEITQINDLNEGNIISINLSNFTNRKNLFDNYFYVSYKTKSFIIITSIRYHAIDNTLVLDYRHSLKFIRNKYKLNFIYCYCSKFRLNNVKNFYEKFNNSNYQHMSIID